MLEETSLVQGPPNENGSRGGSNGTNGVNGSNHATPGGQGTSAPPPGGPVANGGHHEAGLRDGSCEMQGLGRGLLWVRGVFLFCCCCLAAECGFLALVLRFLRIAVRVTVDERCSCYLGYHGACICAARWHSRGKGCVLTNTVGMYTREDVFCRAVFVDPSLVVYFLVWCRSHR